MTRTHPKSYFVAIIIIPLFCAGLAAADSAEAMIEVSKHKGGLTVDRESGELQWEKEYLVMTLTIALDSRRLYFHDGSKVVALNRATGHQVWTSEPLELKQYKLGTATMPSLLVHDDVVICGQGFDFKEGVMLALSAETGEILWKETHPSSGHSSPDDIHIVDGLVWNAGIARINKQGGTCRGRGARITPPVSAGGMVFLVVLDQYTIYALDATNGRRLWTFTAGARIDSSPTYYRGRLVFGSVDGWLYCLDAKGGQLAWRFCAAPDRRMLINDGLIESAWPVHLIFSTKQNCTAVLCCLR